MKPLPRDTPIDVPASKPDLVWDEIAEGLKRDGYNAGVVARKLIEIHGVPQTVAEALVGRLFKKKVDSRGGETTQQIVIGLALAGAGALGAFVFYAMTGLHLRTGVITVYLLLFGLIARGLQQVVVAMINSDT